MLAQLVIELGGVVVLGLNLIFQLVVAFARLENVHPLIFVIECPHLFRIGLFLGIFVHDPDFGHISPLGCALWPLLQLLSLHRHQFLLARLTLIQIDTLNILIPSQYDV